jgi:hypothetical protein
MTASKKGVSAHQVHRMLGVSYKSTWFMMHRLREAMRTGGLEPLGGRGKIVEADETYFWPAPGFEDTELGVLMEPEVGHGAAEIYARVQA